MRINPFVAGTAVSPISQARAAAVAYDGRGGPLIDLSQAAPKYPPPDALRDRLAAAARDAATAGYGDVLGDPDLRDVFAGHVSEVYGGQVSAGEVAITAGCNMGFVAAAIALARAGEAIVLPTPWYFNHKMTLDMLGIAAVPLPCVEANGFVPDVNDAERLIDSRVRAIALVTPNNPTGAVYPPETIHAFADLCARRGIALVIDETYRDFIDPAKGRPHELFAGPGWRGTVVHLYSFSKAYCITGHRAGAMVADGAFLEAADKILDCLQISPPRVPQRALVWAIDAVKDWRERNCRMILDRATAFRAAFSRTNDWSLASIGAYFAYVRHPYPDRSADDVARWLARERGILCLSGTDFGPGQEVYLRLAFANVDPPTIEQIPSRIGA